MYIKLALLTLSFLALFGLSCSNQTKTHTESKLSNDLNMMSDDEMYMLVGTYTSGTSKGIYVYKLDTMTGKSTLVSEVEVDNPSFLVLDKNEKFVYAVTEDEEDEASAANAFLFEKKEGKLIFINKQLTEGGAPCHINIDEKGTHVITANYLGASTSVFKVRRDGGLEPLSQLIKFEGKGIDRDRQNQPHIHNVKYSPDYKYMLISDLGTDKIHKFEVNKDSKNYLIKSNPSAFSVTGGSGPRHLEFHPNGNFAYLLTEISGDVIVFDYDITTGDITQKQVIKADTLNAKGSADIHISPDGKFLYASNRLKGDGIAIFSINQSTGELAQVGYQSTGIHPRNFIITPNGKFLLVANRDSNNIQVFLRDIKTGLLKNTDQDIQLDKPVCLQLASVN